MSYTPFKMKGFSGFGNSPAKHTRSREGHMERYGKGHTNEDHPNYWKKNKGVPGGSKYQKLSDKDLESSRRGKGVDNVKLNVPKLKSLAKTAVDAPTKHIRSAGKQFKENAHLKQYGDKHTNADHPDYWKKIKESKNKK